MNRYIRNNLIFLALVVAAIIVILFIKGFGIDTKIDRNFGLLNKENDEVSMATVTEQPDDFISISDEYFLPILNFHNIGEPPASVSEANRVWYVRDEKLRETLSYIHDNNFKPIFLSELVEYLDKKMLPKNAIVITFDDGASNFYSHAFPLLKEFGVKANVMLMTGVGGSNYLNKEQVKELDGTGLVEFQSHTRYHQYLTRISPGEQKAELEESKKFIEELLGKPVEAVAYPFGLYDDTIIKLTKEVGYKIGLTIKAGTVQNIDTSLELYRNNITNSSNIEKILTTK